MKKSEAIRLGERDGVAEVEDVLQNQGRNVVIATLCEGHLGWDEEAIGAAAHRYSGVPEDLSGAYYEAYARAAREHAQQVAA